MFVVTFYSYKGGVGRTMALMNCAVQLASRGMRTLVVDFDLEAPGISAYPEFGASKDVLGIVDFITEYLETAEAPDISRFMAKCSVDGDLPLWVMPAGRRDADYGAKLGAIDWQNLYERHSGYLLFEDLRQQWAVNTANFDYVLIDSRTGHTDVGGICTRQLADVVVMMFVPNAQNITGLKSVVQDIRSDARERAKQVRLLFCPSNVPDLDDEESILRGKLSLAQDELEYEEPATIIHHYNSLALIDEAIFVRDRPKSRLSAEYRYLHDKISAENIDDRIGALAYVQDLRGSFLVKPWLRSSSEFVSIAMQKMERISRTHNDDGEVAWALSFVYQLFGNLSGEIEALSIAIRNDYSVIDARLRRARDLMSQGKTIEAKADLMAIFGSESASGLQLSSALELVRPLDDNWVEYVQNSPSISKLAPRDASIVAEALMRDPKATNFAFELMQRSLDAHPDESDELDNDLFLALIGAGRFQDAVDFYRRTEQEMLVSTKINDVFNYSMARWGYVGQPSVVLMQRVIDLGDSSRQSGNANFSQCLAISHAVVGNITVALERLEEGRARLGTGKIFSCWSYLTVDRKGMAEDLDKMEVAFRAGEILPEFIRRHEGTVIH